MGARGVTQGLPAMRYRCRAVAAGAFSAAQLLAEEITQSAQTFLFGI